MTPSLAYGVATSTAVAFRSGRALISSHVTTQPPMRFSTRVTPHNRSNDTTVPLRATTAVTGTIKFSVNSSPRPSSRATKPMENAIPASSVLCVFASTTR